MARQLSLKGEWAPGCAGGCPKNETYGLNPQFHLSPSQPASFTITVSQPADASPLLPIGVVLLNREPNAPFKPKLSSKRLVGKTNYKATASQSLTIQLEPPAAGKCYAILPSTFEPEQYGPFTLTVSSDDDAAFTLSAATEPGRIQSSKQAAAGSTSAAAGASSSSGSRVAPANAGRSSATRAPPAPPSGRIRPQDDPTLSAVLQRLRDDPSLAGPFDDPDFRVRLPAAPGAAAAGGASGNKASAVNNKIHFESGHPGPNNTKIDAYHRLSEFAGRGPLTSGSGAASLMCHRRAIADLWLLSAIGMVSTRPDLLETLVAYHDESLGLAALRFFVDGAWKTVVVDDQMPCHGKLKLAYSSNAEPRDGPVCMISKGLAKLYGCYELLKIGRVGSALEDLTGGYHDKLYLRDGVRASDGTLKQPDISVADEASTGVLWVRLTVLLEGAHLLGATYKAKYADLGGSPAIEPLHLKDGENLVYPILELKEVSDASGGGRFVKLRNPWKSIGEGNKAAVWEGPWGQSLPGGAEWNNLPGVAKELGGKPRESESAFWMTWEDFLSGFNKVHICRILSGGGGGGNGGTKWTCCPPVRGEWTAATAGGKLGLPPGPGSRWRSNPQHTLKVSERCTVVISLAQPDALLDANDAIDGYQFAIGFSVLSADPSTPLAKRMLLNPQEDVRYDSRLAATRQVSETLELDPGIYQIVCYTEEPNTILPYILSVGGTAHVSIDPTPAAAAATPPGEAAPEAAANLTTLRGSWSVENGTAGGCPNSPELWTQNPQFVLSCDGPCSAVGVLSLDVSEEIAQAMDRATLAVSQAQQLNDAQAEADAQAALAALAPSIGFFVIRAGSGEAGSVGALTGALEISKDEIVTASPYQHGTQEVSAKISLPAKGQYLLFASTFEAGEEQAFEMRLHITSGSPFSAVRALTKGCEVVDAKRAAAKAGAARPQGPTGPPNGAGGKKFEPPSAKHDVAKARADSASGDGDDGKMGYAQRMELEEAKALEKWVENVPMMTIEGQPLSENVKRRRDAAIKLAMDQCRQTGRKFEDTTWPPKSGRAEGEHQPCVYNKGYPTAGMPLVTQWLRPEEFVNNYDPRYPDSPPTPRQPMLFKSLWEVEGIIQGATMDNKWFVSTLNIVSANRGQLDRIFFGEVDPTWVTYGFFVCKFYQDDPASDDDWQVILVDDRIPCDANGNPVFCRHPDQRTYWGMIIEKAYAKFAGTYEAMQGGTVTQGLEDLTGGIGYKFDLEKKQKEWVHPETTLWDEMMEKMKTEHVIGCANNTKGQPRPNTTKKGIELNRAYAVVTGGDFEDRKLMRLRIPLSPDGTANEWNGKWSDRSGQWSTRMMQMLHYSRDENDGTFWMEYPDFCKHFNKVYMCRMLDDLWTRFAVKSRWMDETAGGCTNFISWRHNNQWLLHIHRPATKLTIKLTQPDARKTSGNGRHYSNAIGFYILKGNSGDDQYRRKLICKDGDEEDGGDFVYVKEPRFTRQVIAEYTFEHPSPTPYILLPYMFEPGREALFRFTILSDDRDDDGQADFGFQEIKPEQDWKHTTLQDSWSRGGGGNPLGDEPSAGGPPSLDPAPPASADAPAWTTNWQFQITVSTRTRCFVFLEPRNIQTDMREVEGLQPEPNYPTVGFWVCSGEGDHIKLEGAKPLEKLFEAPARRGDGVYLEFVLEPNENKYVVIPYMEQPGTEHKYALTLYTDKEHLFEKIVPKSHAMDCVKCGNPTALARVLGKLDVLEAKYRALRDKEALLMQRGLLGSGAPQQTAAQRAFAAADTNKDGKVDKEEFDRFRQHFQQADTDGDGVITEAELAAYTEKVQEHAKAQHASYVQALDQAQLESEKLRQELADALAKAGMQPPPVKTGKDGKSSVCVLL